VTAAATLPVTLLSKSLPVDGSAAGSTTLTLPAAATAGNGFLFYVFKSGTQNNVIIDGNGAETIDGVTTFTLSAQYSGLFLLCDGTGWGTFRDDRTPINRNNRGFSLTLGTDTDHDIDFGAGACWDSSEAFFFSVAAMTKQADAVWAVGSAAGGMDISVSAGFVMAVSDVAYAYAIRKDSDATGDIVFSLSSNWSGVDKTHISAYTYGRRIGAVPTNASRNFISFVESSGVYMMVDDVTVYNTTNTITKNTMTKITHPACPAKALAHLVMYASHSTYHQYASVAAGPSGVEGGISSTQLNTTIANNTGTSGDGLSAIQGDKVVLLDASQQFCVGYDWTVHATYGPGDNTIVALSIGYDLIDRFAEV
jgi:hypothetical protein